MKIWLYIYISWLVDLPIHARISNLLLALFADLNPTDFRRALSIVYNYMLLIAWKICYYILLWIYLLILNQ